MGRGAVFGGGAFEHAAAAVGFAKGGIRGEGAEDGDGAAFEAEIRFGECRAGFGAVALDEGEADLEAGGGKKACLHELCGAKFLGANGPMRCEIGLTLCRKVKLASSDFTPRDPGRHFTCGRGRRGLVQAG